MFDITKSVSCYDLLKLATQASADIDLQAVRVVSSYELLAQATGKAST